MEPLAGCVAEGNDVQVVGPQPEGDDRVLSGVRKPEGDDRVLSGVSRRERLVKIPWRKLCYLEDFCS
jgi:hypothetical protein